MNAHELAQKLLKGPNLPVCLVTDQWDMVDNVPVLCDTIECRVSDYLMRDYDTFTYGKEKVLLLDVTCRPWIDDDYPQFNNPQGIRPKR